MVTFRLLLGLIGHSQFVVGQVDDRQRRKDSLQRMESFKDIDIGPAYVYILDGLILTQEQYAGLKLPDSDITRRDLISRAEGQRRYGSRAQDGGKSLRTQRTWIINNVVVTLKHDSVVLTIQHSHIQDLRTVSANELKLTWGVRNKRGGVIVNTYK